MPISEIYRALRTIALTEFADVVVSARTIALPTGDPLKLRIDVVDGTMLDVFISVSGRYSYHWDRRATSSHEVYRHDNAPHSRARRVSTFPKHFHDGSETTLVDSHLSEDPEHAIREFLTLVRPKLLASR
ncbi:MAG: DUF6516 family protein [Thermodesulfobacteriota bacterium]